MYHRAPVQPLSRLLMSIDLLFGLVSVVALTAGLLSILGTTPQEDSERSLLAWMNVLAPEVIRGLRDDDTAA